jgi:two-component system LytT family response regulator
LLIKAFSSESLVGPQLQGLVAEQFASSREAPTVQMRSGVPSPRIAIKVRGQIVFIHSSDVVSVEAQGNYVLLQRDQNSYLLRDSISAVAAKLEPYGFIRIHRSVLVNSSLVEAISPYSTGECVVKVKGGREYAVTRTYKNNLRFLAKFWIGTGTFFPD